MRRKSKVCLPRYKMTILIAGVCLSLTTFLNVSFGQERKIEPLYLELNKKYQMPEEWTMLPIDLEDPYKRIKNGPPLANVVKKAKIEWISRWIANPKKVVPNAKMPNLGLTFDEIKAILVYLGSISDWETPQVVWDAFLLKDEDDLDDDEYDEMEKIYNTGKGVWGRARCTICHPIKGIGGNVGVGPDLGEITTKTGRNWLHYWIKDPKDYFSDTMMARFRFSDSEIRALVEFIMRDTQFKPEDEDEDEGDGVGKQVESGEQVLKEKEYAGIKNDEALIEKGKRLVEKARCFVCHDVKGITELMPVVEGKREGLAGFDKLLYEINCLVCHRIQNKGGTYAPNLTFVGSKINMKWEKEFLQSPDIIRPFSQQMPKFNLTEEDANIATEFMDKYLLRKVPLQAIFEDGVPSQEIIASGEKLFYEKGCNTCHAEGAKGGGVVGPNLEKVGDRLQPAYIQYHLRNPQLANPQAVEPNFSLSDDELKMLVGFLMDHVQKKEGK
ncbi:MAG: c-type cytochrome [Candidatus Loosdrechtia sp.]|uniref:c-type cytochrome n=1 Tax=Candidatus Loosdrechtia sp. TaxID=3101272 RepID=UPI003A70EAB2|nr:MAG: c-type cytochrome [Candidatus Jettenia sp. AMX2]